MSRAGRRRGGGPSLKAPGRKASAVRPHPERRRLRGEWPANQRPALDGQTLFGICGIEVQRVCPGRGRVNLPVGGWRLPANLTPLLANLECEQQRPPRECDAVVET